MVARLRGGRVLLSADFTALPDNLDEGIVLPDILPDTIMTALIGRPLRALIEHPLLPDDAIIADVVRRYGLQTHVRLSSETRPVAREELHGKGRKASATR